MSFPPRPPPGMMAGMPPMYGIVPPPPMPPHMVGAPPMRPRAPFMGRPRGPPPNIPRDASGSPPVTVFVGNISERAQDTMIRTLLASCGPLVSWKRVQGATGKLQAFGFCEYASPEHALRAIRILHDFSVGDKKLVVKVDAKTKTLLDEYKKKRRKIATGKSPTSEENEADFMDDEVRHADKMTSDQIASILKDHEKEMNNFVPMDSWKERKPRVDDPDSRQTGPKQSLDDVDMEDNKRDIIHREIDKFREIMKLREAEKEEEKKKRDKDTDKVTSESSSSKRERSKDREPREREDSSERRKERERSLRRRHSPSRSVSRGRSVSPRAERSSRSQSHRHRERRTRSRSRSKSRSRSRERRDRDRGDRDRGDRDRDRDRIRERETPGRKSAKEIWKEEEMEEEAKERKKAERKARDKEASYQERLRRWEDRETRRVKDYEKEREKEQKRLDDVEREAKKIKEFLEDYDDDRDDPKYYKGSKLEQRLAERNRELQKDVEDRQREKEEVEELRSQIIKEGFKDPSAELQRRLAEQERFNNPAIFHHQQQRRYEEVVLDADVPPHHVPETTNGQFALGAPFMKVEADFTTRIERGPPVVILEEEDDDHHADHMNHGGHSDNDDDGGHYDAAPSPTYSQNSNSNSGFRRSPKSRTPSEVIPPSAVAGLHHKSPVSAVPLPPAKQSFQMTSNRRKIDVKDVFNQDDEDTTVAKKRKLPIPPTASSHDKKSSGKDRESSDDKRRHIKSLIDKIPTAKNALFEYKVEWDLVDNTLMEKRIRPWVSKKIAEYIGEPEPTLSDFICTKVLAGSTPKAVLEDVQMVLDDEAEVFVVKLWRLLIYEIENKKLKATISSSSTTA